MLFRSADILSDDMRVPMCDDITQPNKTIKVIFDMENDLARGLEDVVKIQKNMTRRIRFAHGRWFTTDQDGKFHMWISQREKWRTRKPQTFCVRSCSELQLEVWKLRTQRSGFERVEKDLPNLKREPSWISAGSSYCIGREFSHRAEGIDKNRNRQAM